MSGGTSLEQRRTVLEQACEALEGLSEELWSAGGAELGSLLGLVDRVGELAGAGRVAVVSEAVERGEAGGGTPGAQRWAREHAASMRAGGSAQVVRVVEHLRLPRYAALRAAVLGAQVPVANAACVVEEYERVAHRLHPWAQGPAMDLLVALAQEGGRREIRGVRRRIVARYGYDGEFQGEQDRLRDKTLLSQPMDDGTGLYEYRVLADAEAMATIEAAVQALSAPRPVEGAPDRRPSGQRRFEALVEVVRRGVAAAPGVPVTPKAELFVTMDLHDLLTRTGAGTVTGSSVGSGLGSGLGSGRAGELLGPETVRRVACDAGIVPVVLGTDGQVVDLGRRHRLFSSLQVRALWLRDGGCSFPGCTVPATWCDAHHLWHWADGGPTDLDNAALLCGRHHAVVHAQGHHGQVRDGTVAWDLTSGTYDAWLTARRAVAGDAAAGDAAGGNAAGGDSAADVVVDALGREPTSTTRPGPPAGRTFDVWDQLQTGAAPDPPPPWRP